MTINKKVGILALQGDFSNHLEALQELGAKCLLIKNSQELDSIDALIIPGGESTAMLKLMDDEFREKLRKVISSGLPTLATCAGVILLAKKVENPAQHSLGLLNVTVVRNGYGRQIDSTVVNQLELTEIGKERFADTQLEGVFIRAPIISEVAPEIEVLSTREKAPVLIKQANIWAATFHPELTKQPSLVHREFLQSI